MAEPVLSTRALNRALLARQLLLARHTLKVVTAVERLAGLQAQVPRPPFVGLWTRLDGFTRQDLVRAIDKRDLVRATMMRGTIHLVSRKDYLAFRPGLQPMFTAAAKAVLKDRTPAAILEPLLAAARSYFADEPRTFAELRRHLGSAFSSVDERALGYMVRMHLPLVQTPVAGATWAYPAAADFTLADTWLNATVKTSGSLEALALGYFAAFGPASAKDLQTWSGTPEAAAAVEGLRKKLVVFRDERGRELFDLPKAPRPAEDEEAPVRFLPEYDNVLLAYADRLRIVPPAFKSRLITRNLMIPATFLVDGMVAGLWKAGVKKRTATLQLEPFAPLSKAVHKALAAEGDRLLQFLEPEAGERAVTTAK